MHSGTTSPWDHRVGRARLLSLVLAGGVLAALLPTTAAQAARRFDVPEEAPGPPYYARLGLEDGAPHTDQWAAIVFYRDPSCVPLDFNLLDFFDLPRAFRCPLTVEGFEIWENGPGSDPAPKHVELRDARPVPVWFVSWEELQAAMADQVLTITELQELPSLVVGEASFFKETLHPLQGARRSNIQMNAAGTLSDGRSFRFRFTHVHDTPNETKDVAIIFR